MNKKIMSTALITLISSSLNVYALELNKTEVSETTNEVSAITSRAATQSAIVNTENLNVRKGASTSYSVITTIKKNTIVQIIGNESNGWCQISVNGKTGWVNGKYLTKVSTKTGITTTNLNVRKGASTSYAKLGTLSKGTKVDIYETKNGWHRIKYNGQDGWVSASYVTIGSSSNANTNINTNTSTDKVINSGVVCNTTSLNVRKGASTSYDKIGSLSKGTKVDIYETKNGWHRIKYNGQDGWVSASYINTSSSSNSSSTSTTKGVIHTYDVNIRKTADYSGTVVGTIKKNTSVEVLSSNSTWTKVRYNGQEGYVMTKYININGTVNDNTTSNNTSSYKTGTVTAIKLNVRSGASTSFPTIGSLNKGEQVSVISTESNGWHKIKLSNGKEGYVSGQYITFGGTSSNTGTPVSKKLIAIDFGHQLPINAGAVGIKKEDTVIKEVGDRLISKLKSNGYNVINVTPSSATSISNSLAKRAQAANNAGADLFISIHFNAASSSSANGAEVFYSTRSGSTTLAKEILDEIVSLGYRNRGIKNGSNLAVLRQTNMTGVLVECAFLTNQGDMNRYNPDTMSNAIFNGIVDYLR